ncbi:hypothetical protein COHA_006055 [Chlorella ohadii]|uniref:ARID domain-containing protein n=1 Tax=Chlorella ohadii TaxID=2649997 RepID=A0AAD5H479_9CHLO|nr:hypothetical protein COHA_006055 [Chlorella ohadii]
MSAGKRGKPQAGAVSMAAMRAHLETAFIGYRPGDPTAAVPPAAMPRPGVPPPPGGLKTLDLRQMTMAQLHAEAAATHTRDLFAALLPDPPGVPLERIAYVTGHGPDVSEGEDEETEEEEQQQQQRKKQKQQEQKQQRQKQQQQGQTGQAGSARAKLSEGKLFSLLDQYLAADPGRSNAAAAAGGSQGQRRSQAQQSKRLWSAFGLAAAPRFGGIECDLPRLWGCVRQRGGSNAVSRDLAWTAVAQDLGIDIGKFRNAGFYAAQWYGRLLQPYERSRQQQAGSTAQRRSKAAAAVEEEDAGPAVPE